MESSIEKTEWALLHDVASGKPEALGALANHYNQRGAWDEYSAVRTRMLERAKPGPGPAPGGPFPRIGMEYEVDPPTILARCLNRTVLPELYARDQVEQRALAARFRAALRATPALHVRLADVLYSQLHFAEAETHYHRAIVETGTTNEDRERARSRLSDVQRILRGN